MQRCIEQSRRISTSLQSSRSSGTIAPVGKIQFQPWRRGEESRHARTKLPTNPSSTHSPSFNGAPSILNVTVQPIKMRIHPLYPNPQSVRGDDVWILLFCPTNDREKGMHSLCGVEAQPTPVEALVKVILFNQASARNPRLMFQLGLKGETVIGGTYRSA